MIQREWLPWSYFNVDFWIMELWLMKVSKFNSLLKIQQLRRVFIQQKIHWLLVPGRYSMDGFKFNLTSVLTPVIGLQLWLLFLVFVWLSCYLSWFSLLSTSTCLLLSSLCAWNLVPFPRTPLHAVVKASRRLCKFCSTVSSGSCDITLNLFL